MAEATSSAAPATRAERFAGLSVALVTPFPPDRSGVADYSRETVRALARLVEVDIYTDQPAPTATPGVRRFYPISAAPWLRPDYDAVVSIIAGLAAVAAGWAIGSALVS